MKIPFQGLIDTPVVSFPQLRVIVFVFKG